MTITKSDYESNKLLMLSLKIKCCKCGESDPCCLEFHHVRDKIMCISHAVKNMKPDKFKEELDKCICVCSNCHKKIHNEINK